MIFKNALIYKEGQFEKSDFFVENGMFVERPSESSKKNLQGFYVMPGYIDSHAHIIGVGKKYLQLNLENVKSQEEMYELISKCNASVVVGRGWSEEKLKGCPDKRMLDKFDKPVILIRRCGHVAIVNKKAMEIAGIQKEDGIFKEEELEILKSKFPDENYEQYFQVGQNAFLSKGVTFVHSDDLHGISWENLKKVLLGSKIRIFEKLYLPNVDQLENFNEFGRLTERVFVGGVKLFADGSLGGKTAYLSKPYPNSHGYRGTKLIDEDKLRQYAELCKEKRIQLCVHAIGDAAVSEVANVFKDFPNNRIIHVQLIKKEDLEKLRETYISIQPHFAFEDDEIKKSHIPQDLDALTYPFIEMFKMGLKIGFSSDAPVSPEDPKYVIEAALKLGFSPKECVDLYTTANAQMVKIPLGKIEPGYMADFAIYERNPMKFEDDPVAVYVAGELVWEK
ncbi:amidohydrolase [Pseudothermotoga thermarum]|nr:amidohydrolase [Pseudothermotoga thermarum]